MVYVTTQGTVVMFKHAHTHYTPFILHTTYSGFYGEVGGGGGGGGGEEFLHSQFYAELLLTAKYNTYIGMAGQKTLDETMKFMWQVKLGQFLYCTS